MTICSDDLQTSAAWIAAGCRHKRRSVDSFHGLKEPLFHSALSWSSGGAQRQPLESGGVGGGGDEWAFMD